MEVTNHDTKEALEERIRIMEERINAQEDMLERTTSYMSKVQGKLADSKKTVEEKNEQINDSLRYARRLQRSLRPDEDQLSASLSDHFIHLKETELIGGDLAYVRCTSDATFVAAIDCTGHGIPGAMLSMMAYSYLNEIILKQDFKEPSKILDQLNRMMFQSLRSKTEEIKDGLDMGLLRIAPAKNSVSYAGARRPLMHIQNEKVENIKGTKHSIAESSEASFDQIDMVVDEGHRFYLFSDGITDQFGGPKDKKFGRKRLSQLIGAIKDLNMEKQLEIITHTLESWQGNQEQTDDQVIIGVKI